MPHAPYSVSESLWALISQHSGGSVLSLHNQETSAENEWFIEKKGALERLFKNLQIDTSLFQPSGKTSLQTCLRRFQPKQQLILVHNVVTSIEDLLYCEAQLPDQQRFWCLCPNANLFISNILPPVELFRRHGCQLVLGTDSLASNDQLSILSEMQTIRQHFPLIPIPEMLSWATLNGAKALHLDGLLGSFEKGKKPGVLLLKEDLSQVTRLM